MIFICHPIYVKYIKLPSSYFNVPNPTINLKAKMCDKQIKVAKKLVYQLRNTHNPTFFPTKKKKKSKLLSINSHCKYDRPTIACIVLS